MMTQRIDAAVFVPLVVPDGLLMDRRATNTQHRTKGRLSAVSEKVTNTSAD
jgi:hypothetical protein